MYAMVNLIAGRRVVAELIQDACTAEAVAAEAVALLTDAGYRARMIEPTWPRCAAGWADRAPATRAADAVLDVIHSTDAPSVLGTFNLCHRSNLLLVCGLAVMPAQAVTVAPLTFERAGSPLGERGHGRVLTCVVSGPTIAAASTAWSPWR